MRAEIEIKVLESSRRILGEDHPETIRRTGDLARLYVDQGKSSQAEEMSTKVVDYYRRILRKAIPIHRRRCTVWHLFCVRRGNEKAEALYTRVLEFSRRVLGEDHPGTLTTTNRLAELYEDRGMHTKAEPLLNNAYRAGHRGLGDNNQTVQDTLRVLGLVRMGQKKYVEAEPLLRQTLAYCEKTVPDHWRRFWAESLLGNCLSG